jgi:hypothetical protein
LAAPITIDAIRQTMRIAMAMIQLRGTQAS